MRKRVEAGQIDLPEIRALGQEQRRIRVVEQLLDDRGAHLPGATPPENAWAGRVALAEDLREGLEMVSAVRQHEHVPPTECASAMSAAICSVRH